MKELWPTIDNLEDKVKRLEQLGGVEDREIPIPCPFCGQTSDLLNVQSFLGTDMTGLTGKALTWYAVECKKCYSHGPGMQSEKDAIWGWNQFVSHRGKVPRE